MIYKMTVPRAVNDVEEIRVLEWHGEPGHRFEVDDLIVELETHKAVVEVRAGQASILRQILAVPGDWKEIGLPIAILSDEADEPIPDLDVIASDLVMTFEVC